MTSNIEFKYNGKVYQLGAAGGHCRDCVFNDGVISCTVVMDAAETQTGHRCDEYSWQEKQETVKESEPSILTWTMEEIRKAHDKYDMRFPSGFVDALLKMKDPEYQKYLELKAKFGE